MHYCRRLPAARSAQCGLPLVASRDLAIDPPTIKTETSDLRILSAPRSLAFAMATPSEDRESIDGAPTPDNAQATLSADWKRIHAVTPTTCNGRKLVATRERTGRWYRSGWRFVCSSRITWRAASSRTHFPQEMRCDDCDLAGIARRQRLSIVATLGRGSWIPPARWDHLAIAPPGGRFLSPREAFTAVMPASGRQARRNWIAVSNLPLEKRT